VALVLLEQVRERLRKEFEQKGKSDLFNRLQGCLCEIEPDVPYALVSKDTGMTESAIKVSVHRIRRRYRDLLRDQIAQTVLGPEDIDDEIKFLLSAVGR
jgi:RNA polymerase sigma-70 factor (ECF subfamily)